MTRTNENNNLEDISNRSTNAANSFRKSSIATNLLVGGTCLFVSGALFDTALSHDYNGGTLATTTGILGGHFVAQAFIN